MAVTSSGSMHSLNLYPYVLPRHPERARGGVHARHVAPFGLHRARHRFGAAGRRRACVASIDRSRETRLRDAFA